VNTNGVIIIETVYKLLKRHEQRIMQGKQFFISLKEIIRCTVQLRDGPYFSAGGRGGWAIPPPPQKKKNKKILHMKNC